MPYTSGIGFRSWHADHPSFKRLGAGTPSRFALVFTSAIERVPKQNRPILSRACPRVSERILAKKRVSEFPNIDGILKLNLKNLGLFGADSSGSFHLSPGAIDIDATTIKGTGQNEAVFEASASNAIYGGSTTVQPSSLRALVLVRAY